MEISEEKPARWSLNTASAEFGCARETLRGALRQAHIEAGEDQRYSTRQICQALFGDLKAEKTGLTRAQREKIEQENKENAGELIRVDDAIALAGRFAYAARQKILLSKLSEEDKNAVLMELQRLGEINFNDIGDSEDNPLPA